MTRPKWIDPETYAESVSRKTCQHCDADLLTARVGRRMALDVRVDTEPVLDGRWLSDGRLTWCWTGKRLLWRDHKRCGHIVLADHLCKEDDMNKDDPFDIDSTPTKKRSPYEGMIHPVTGKLLGRHVRATNYIKAISDDFDLNRWTNRMIVKGLAESPEILDAIRDLDVSRDAGRMNKLCADAKRRAGGDDAAALGTHLHSQTEYGDRGQFNKIDNESLSRVIEYKEALKSNSIKVIPELIERKIWHTGLDSQVTGTFDRIVRLNDGTHAILDVKTGSLDPERYMEKWLSIATQLAIYQEAVNAHGVWNAKERLWDLVPRVREDFAIVAHLPAKGVGCRLYTVDLELGRHGLAVCRAVREVRKSKNFVDIFVSPVAPTVKGSDPDAFLIETAQDQAELVRIMEALKTTSAWSEHYANLCRARLKVINSRA